MTDVSTIVRILVLLLLIALTVILVTRRLSVPYTLGLVIVGLLISIFGLLPDIHLTPDLVLFVFLPALLFEGSWSIYLKHLRENWLPIFLLAGPGLLLSLVLIALFLHFLAGLEWSLAFLLGAILSPTDPVAVLSLFRQLKVNVRLSTIIEGESLFNDGVAGSLYQTFLAIVLLSLQGHASSGVDGWLHGLFSFLLEAGGGALIGILCGFLISRLVKLIDEPLIETTITIITAYGVYMLADAVHTSAILAVIIASLILGSYGRNVGMSEHTREAVDTFWSMIAFLANALLFLLVGTQLNLFQFLSSSHEPFSLVLTAVLAIVAVLLARFVMVLTLRGLALLRPLGGTIILSWRFIIFWSGLRGALSLALVLALPLEVPKRDDLIFSTYAVVLFTLLVQGFSLRSILKRLPSTAEVD
jgi:monovalent cation:H+ antiporter, CPA1 family